MSERPEVEIETEKIARRIAKSHGHESLWELYLGLAYQEYFGLESKPGNEDGKYTDYPG